MKEEKTRKYRVGADLVGKDRFHNRYWMFSWNPEVLYVEYVSSSGANGTCTGTASSGRYVLYMLVVLVVSLPGQHYENTWITWGIRAILFLFFFVVECTNEYDHY